MYIYVCRDHYDNMRYHNYSRKLVLVNKISYLWERETKKNIKKLKKQNTLVKFTKTIN